jgi:hypothetical protein
MHEKKINITRDVIRELLVTSINPVEISPEKVGR